MSKKHFQALARAIAELQLTKHQRVKVAVAIAKVCNRFNDNFQFSVFYDYCGVDYKTIGELLK